MLVNEFNRTDSITMGSRLKSAEGWTVGVCRALNGRGVGQRMFGVHITDELYYSKSLPMNIGIILIYDFLYVYYIKLHIMSNLGSWCVLFARISVEVAPLFVH